MFSRRFIAILLPAIVLLAGTARASIVPPVTFDEIVQGSDIVIRGEVVRTDARFVDTPSGRAIITIVTFRIERTLKGRAEGELSLEFLGGQVGEVRLDVAGAPRFTVGERNIICVRAGGRHVSPVVGFNQGRFRVARDSSGRDYVTTHDGWAFSSVRALGRPRAMVTAAPVQTLALDAFEAEILRTVGR
jgi:hypothetical protein